MDGSVSRRDLKGLISVRVIRQGAGPELIVLYVINYLYPQNMLVVGLIHLIIADTPVSQYKSIRNRRTAKAPRRKLAADPSTRRQSIE